MKLLMIGAGGVGQSAVMLIKSEPNGAKWLEKMVVADYDAARAKEVVALADDKRFIAEQIDAGNGEAIIAMVKKYDCDFILNLVAPNFNETIFDAAYEAGVGYMDCAMTLSKRHPEKPFELPYIKLGDYQFERYDKWKEKGLLALVGSGVEPGVADVFAKYAATHLFDEIDEVNVRDGDNYEVPGVDVSFGFSVWTTIEECLNPPIIWEKKRGWFTTENFSEPEVFCFPGGIGDVEVINVEHEEVLLVPRVIDCNRVTFKYGVTPEFRTMLKNLESLGMAEASKKIKVGNSEIAPRDFLVKVAPSPLETAKLMVGKGCAGTWVTGKKEGLDRSVYLYQVADNQECLAKYGTNSVVAQTAVGPVVMLDLIANGIWKGAGVCGPETFDPDPFVEKMAVYGFPAGIQEKDSPYAEKLAEEAILEVIPG
ncbi:MAG: saccharopine dehydrogenase NADP-binding domain-containing protein [Clostridiales bacterium]|nr:saccharopine dehydrogenase NADP-binding domain-containing protein [Clostridiales bacterium]